MAEEQSAGAKGAGAGDRPAESLNPEAGAAPAGEQVAGAPATDAGDDVYQLTERLAAAEAENAGLKDQILRAQAEAENVRRRAQRDVENAHKFALEKFCSDLLPVIDSLEKAVDIARKGEGGDVAAIAEGVELSLRMFLGVMNKAGVEQVNPLGEPFDPQRHEAMAMVPNPHAEPNSVMDVMQKGYLLNGRLVRAAMVVVSKAPA
jgi:molecular chaperone GrpE